jgi:phage shock protein A
MGISPVTPNFTQNIQNYTPKSFWKRPEGPFGMVVLAALILAGAWGLYLILPFLISLLTDTLHMVALAAVLIAILWLVFNPTFRAAVTNLFENTVRFFASWVVETDPIGILRNNLDDMKKAKYDLDQTLQRFAGSDERLQRSIAAKTDEINALGHKAQKAEQLANAASDPMEKERLQLERQTFLEQAGMLMQGVKQLQALEDQTAKMLKTFQHWSQISDSKIQRTENKVNFLAEQRKMILDAKATLGVGQQLLRGNPEQLKMVDMALEYLEDDTSRTLGEIREFSRYTDKLLTDDQIESGAAADEAAAKFAEFNQKLLTSGSQSTGADMIHIPGMEAPEPVKMPTTLASVAASSAKSADDYDNMFK